MIPLKILVADDDPVIRLLLETVLSTIGHEIVTTGDGVTALSLLQEESYNLIITDLQMGSSSGMDVIREAKELYPDLIVFLMTGCRDIQHAVEAYQLGADAFLTKPLDMEELINLIQFNAIKYISAGCIQLQRAMRAMELSG